MRVATRQEMARLEIVARKDLDYQSFVVSTITFSIIEIPISSVENAIGGKSFNG